MGTKGRDICLWLFFALIMACLLANGAIRIPIFAMALLMALGILHYYTRYLPNAIKSSRNMGLNMIVLLPLNTFLARALLQLDGERISFCGAYEVHIRKGEKHALGDYLRLFTLDLEIARMASPGSVFVWETSAPLPLFVRRLVRQGSADGSAFLKRGGWPLPKFPFTETDLQSGRVKHGAIIA
jgi:hypothetical protein